MDRSEPSFIPGWLKGTAGGGLATHNNSDEGGFSRNKTTQQLLSVGNNLDSPRKSTSSSSNSFSSTSRRSNGATDRSVPERDQFGGLVRSKSSLNRSSSNRSHKLNLEQNGYKSWINGEYVHEKDNTRQKEWLSGMVPDGRDRDKEIGESATRQLSGLPGKFDMGTKLKRSQSSGLSPRLDSGASKQAEVVSALPSSNGNSITMKKTVFEQNFPSLITDDKASSPRLSTGSNSIASPRPCVANPHVLWQGNSRSDISRASSPGLVGSFANPISTGNSAGSEIWSSALADVPMSNGNVHCTGLAANPTPTSSFVQTSSSLVHGPVTSATPLNMAEALTQNPPRVRTPPQLSLEIQRLEELALRQSRQLIPVTPQLPKAMSLVDKGKSKTPRTGDGPISTSKVQLNSSQKSTTPSRPDISKSSQGKLLVLKSGKDGVSVTTTSKSDVTVVPQVISHGNMGLTAGSTAGMSVSATGVLGQRKQAHDRRAISLQGGAVSDGSRSKDLFIAPDDKRLSLHAQNRSDFFNAIRKKSAGNGSNVNASSTPASDAKTDSFNAAPVDNDLETKGNGVCEDPHHSESTQSSKGDVMILVETKGSLLEGESKEERGDSICPGDLEEEEAAFMRSLGWEENEEGSELTEEEINAFYQMCEMKKLLNGKGNYNRREHEVGSVGSMSSGLSSSDSETDEAVYSNSTRI